MKLVEILARELKEWPKEATHAVQERIGKYEKQVWLLKGDQENTRYKSGEWILGDSVWPIHAPSFVSENMADDQESAIITRAQWQAERDRIAAIDEGIKAADSGKADPIEEVKAKWIRHRGGKCPVETGAIIDVRHRDGEVFESIIAGEHFCCKSWTHDDAPGDIMAWRPSVIEDEKQEMAVSELTIKVDTKDALAAVDAEVARHVADHPFTWRDRIREIDAQQVALTNERAELVAKLAADGLALCGEPIKAVAPTRDMSDWRNWREGDLVSAKSNCIGGYDDHFSKGDLYPVTAVDHDDPELPVEVDALWLRANELHEIEWHSHP